MYTFSAQACEVIQRVYRHHPRDIVTVWRRDVWCIVLLITGARINQASLRNTTGGSGIGISML